MDPKTGPEPSSRTGNPVKRIESETLFEGRPEIVILHRQEEYRLRVTKSDKLILTK